MALDPINQIFCSTLIALLRNDQQLGPALARTMLEVRALREAVSGLDPTFSDVLSEKRKVAEKAVQQTAGDSQVPSIEEMPQLLDGMIQLLQQLEKGETS